MAATDESRVRRSLTVTGIAGPGGGNKKKPVGLVYIGIRCVALLKTVENIFSGNRDQIREQACDKALETLIVMLAE